MLIWSCIRRLYIPLVGVNLVVYTSFIYTLSWSYGHFQSASHEQISSGSTKRIVNILRIYKNLIRLYCIRRKMFLVSAEIHS